MHRQRAFLLVALVLLVAASAHAQVTTATLVGLVRDNSGAVIPGASVIATHEGTGVAREGVSDANGEFVLAALPSGPYALRIELTGFKTISQRGIELGAGQTVRQTFLLEVGAMSETVTVTGDAPLVQTAMSLQADSLGSQEVRELPVNRRNIQGLIGLTAGVVITGTGAAGGSGGVQMNGVASGGTGITVDGTEANSNPEGRSLTQYGSENQISVMSLDSIAEVQIVKGVLPAEYGGVAGGQINVISRSGTNIFHGSAFYSGQKERWNARDFFSTAQQPVGAFNQYGGTLGGPVLKNKVFFFGTYEGYREKVELNLNTTVPYQAVRDEVLRALPYPETTIAMNTLYLPTETIVSAAGVVNPQVGRWRGLGVRRRSENHIVAKADMAVFNGANLTFTYTRLRPFTLDPRPNPDGVNDREFPNRAGSHRRAVCDDEGRMGVGKPRWMEQGVPGASRQVPVGHRAEPATRDHAVRQARGVLQHQRPVRHGALRNPGDGGYGLQFRAEIQPWLSAASREGGIPLPARDRQSHQSGRSCIHVQQLCRHFSRTS